MHGKGKLRWLVGNYEAGDVVFHNPWMIHAATKNEDEYGRIRLASDLRFYEEGAAIDERWIGFKLQYALAALGFDTTSANLATFGSSQRISDKRGKRPVIINSPLSSRHES